MRASVSEVKAGLSGYLKRVKAGEELVITERGKPVARVSRVTSEDKDAAYMEDLYRAGLATPPQIPGGLPAEFWDLPFPEDPDGLALKYLREDRDSRG
jgi:prevent-host-death family protein